MLTGPMFCQISFTVVCSAGDSCSLLDLVTTIEIMALLLWLGWRFDGDGNVDGSLCCDKGCVGERQHAPLFAAYVR